MNDKYVKLADVKRKLRYIFKAYGVGGFVREKVERALNNLPYSVKGDLETTLEVADVKPVDRWISIEESKPKDMQQVLAVVDGAAREAFYNAGCFIGSNFYRSINEVKWWQPLPEPPKDGDTE